MRDTYRSRGNPHSYRPNQGDDVASHGVNTDQEDLDLRAQHSANFKIAWVADTQAAAERQLNCILQLLGLVLPESANGFNRHHLSAHGLDQSWPGQKFDELHLLRSALDPPLPTDHLDRLADIIHIHHLAPCRAQAYPGCRSYLWSTEQALCGFWASLYLARERQNIPALDWDSYCAWQPAEGCIGQAITSWGATPAAAIDALLAQKQHAKLATRADSLLVIEGSRNLSIGDYVDILEAFENEFGYEVISTGWTAPDYPGCGLKLLTFSPLPYHPPQPFP